MSVVILVTENVERQGLQVVVRLHLLGLLENSLYGLQSESSECLFVIKTIQTRSRDSEGRRSSHHFFLCYVVFKVRRITAVIQTSYLVPFTRYRTARSINEIIASGSRHLSCTHSP